MESWDSVVERERPPAPGGLSVPSGGEGGALVGWNGSWAGPDPYLFMLDRVDIEARLGSTDQEDVPEEYYNWRKVGHMSVGRAATDPSGSGSGNVYEFINLSPGTWQVRLRGVRKDGRVGPASDSREIVIIGYSSGGNDGGGGGDDDECYVKCEDFDELQAIVEHIRRRLDILEDIEPGGAGWIPPSPASRGHPNPYFDEGVYHTGRLRLNPTYPPYTAPEGGLTALIAVTANTANITPPEGAELLYTHQGMGVGGRVGVKVFSMRFEEGSTVEADFESAPNTATQGRMWTWQGVSSIRLRGDYFSYQELNIPESGLVPFDIGDPFSSNGNILLAVVFGEPNRRSNAGNFGEAQPGAWDLGVHTSIRGPSMLATSGGDSDLGLTLDASSDVENVWVGSIAFELYGTPVDFAPDSSD